MQKGAGIGKGMTAEVYEWGQDRVLKLYYDWFPRERIDYEAQIGKSVYEAGVSSPKVYELLEVEGRMGIVYERIQGDTMFRVTQNKPWKLIEISHCMAGLHAQMHGCCSDKLPSQKECLSRAIKASSGILGDKVEPVIEYLDRLPGGKCICHGDFHPDNIIVSDKGPVTIDWTNACTGNPYGDVARTCLMIASPFMPSGASRVMVALSRLAKRLIYKAYLSEYLKFTKAQPDSIDAWMLPIAAARLREKIPGEENWLMAMINTRLQHLNSGR